MTMFPYKPAPQRLVLVCQLFYPELVSTGQTLTELGEELARRGVQLKVVASQPIIMRRDEHIAPHIVHEGISITAPGPRASQDEFFRQAHQPNHLFPHFDSPCVVE
jgi:hypothetical protein